MTIKEPGNAGELVHRSLIGIAYSPFHLDLKLASVRRVHLAKEDATFFGLFV